jgi:hypothetical protein
VSTAARHIGQRDRRLKRSVEITKKRLSTGMNRESRHSRRSPIPGVEAITYAKMRTLRQLAALWMREHRMKASSIRLDAIGVVLAPDQKPSLTHVRGVG